MIAAQRIEAMPPAAEDKGYDSKALRDWLAERGTTSHRGARMTRPSTAATSSSACFAASRTRRIATRFDRNIKNFIAAIALAAAVIWWL